MTLMIGELAGIIDLDDKPFEKGLDGVEGKAGKSFDKIKALMAGAAVAGAALFTKSLFDGMNIEAATDKLTAQLGLTEDQSAAFGRAAGQLYADNYGDSIGQVHEALGAVHSTLADSLGNAEDALSDATGKALNLASVFDIVNSAGVLFTSGLARDANHAFDLITASLQRVPAHLREDLLDAVDEYGVFFADLGISAEESMGILIEASAGGMYSLDKTGDALKELGIRATDMSTTSIGAYQAAGLNAEGMAGRFLAGGATAKGALDELVKGLLGMEDPVARSNAAIALFGTPLEDLSVNEIPEFLGSLSLVDGGLGNVTGAADKMGDTLAGNAKSKMETYRREALMATADFINTKAIPAFEWLTDMVSENKDVVAAAAIGIAAVFLPALAAWALAAGAAALATLAAAAPVVALAGVIALLAFGIMKLVQNWSDVFAKVKEITLGALNWLRDQFGKLPGWIGDAMSGLAEIITAPYRIGFNAIARLWNKTVGSLSFSVPDWVPGIGGKGWSVPNIPTFHGGGIFHAPTPGGEGLALLRDGERVQTAQQQQIEDRRSAAGRSDDDVPYPDPEEWGRQAAQAFARESKTIGRAA
jgi:phage-related minor tail protein